MRDQELPTLEDEINHFEQEIYSKGMVIYNITSSVDDTWNKLIVIVHYGNKSASSSWFREKANKAPTGSNSKVKNMFCVGCGHELTAAYTTNFCPNCGQAIKEEHKIAKYTSDGKPINQTKDQKSIPSKVPTTDIKVNAEAPKAKGIAEPVNYDTKHINKPSSGKGTAIGALIVIIIIIVIVAAVANWFYQQGQQTDKLLELGCTPEAWGSMGIPTIWSCPAWRNIDVNDPKTFMDQSPAGPNR